MTNATRVKEWMPRNEWQAQSPTLNRYEVKWYRYGSAHIAYRVIRGIYSQIAQEKNVYSRKVEK